MNAAALIALVASMSAASAGPVDSKALINHMRKSFSIPAEMAMTIKDVKASPVPGFWTVTLETSFKGQSRTQPLQVSKDNRFYFLSDANPLTPSNIPGLLGPDMSKAEGVPQVFVTPDSKFFIAGPAKDMTIDQDAINLAKVDLSNTPVKGKESAPILFIEYSDLQCPYCLNAHKMLEDNLLKTYGDKVRWAHKHFPLVSIHPWAYAGAVASACAGKQKGEAAWKMRHEMFLAQKEITKDNVGEKAFGYAKKFGLDEALFKTCFEKQETKDIVDAHVREAESLGINSTPTFLVNGRVTPFQGGFEPLKSLIDQMLKEKASKK